MLPTPKIRRWGFFLILFSTLTFALPEDQNQLLHIVADSTLINYKTGINTYDGNVRVDQGTTHLIADRLITKNENHQLVSAIAYGLQRLATYTTLPKKGDPLLQARAKIITFYPPTSTVVLENNVIVTQGKNSFHGTHIIYNMKDQTVSAPPEKNGRATIVIDSKQIGS